MRREATGRHELTSTAGEAVRAFVTAPLPPDPPVVLHARCRSGTNELC